MKWMNEWGGISFDHILSPHILHDWIFPISWPMQSSLGCYFACLFLCPPSRSGVQSDSDCGCKTLHTISLSPHPVHTGLIILCLYGISLLVLQFTSEIKRYIQQQRQLIIALSLVNSILGMLLQHVQKLSFEICMDVKVLLPSAEDKHNAQKLHLTLTFDWCLYLSVAGHSSCCWLCTKTSRVQENG